MYCISSEQPQKGERANNASLGQQLLVIHF